ncbi:hypothetical protein PCCS19_34830 [Paenibacillus sp. CCS19]|nr:hypothetical protein PCCS19_34830 [Paenibacillus cellulosilyticus]
MDSLILSLSALKDRIRRNPIFEIQRELGYTMTCSFLFYNPATEQLLSEFCNDTGFNLSHGFRKFLMIHDGAILFKDQSNRAEPPWLIFGLDQIVDHLNDFPAPEHMYPIAKYDQTIIYVNDLLLKEGKDNYLYDRTIYDPSDHEGTAIGLNFELWFERLIVSQGAHFWFWNTK